MKGFGVQRPNHYSTGQPSDLLLVEEEKDLHVIIQDDS